MSEILAEKDGEEMVDDLGIHPGCKADVISAANDTEL
jgi:hypothetical protein